VLYDPVTRSAGRLAGNRRPITLCDHALSERLLGHVLFQPPVFVLNLLSRCSALNPMPPSFAF